MLFLLQFSFDLKKFFFPDADPNERLSLPPTLSPAQRLSVHCFAEKNGLISASEGKKGRGGKRGKEKGKGKKGRGRGREWGEEGDEDGKNEKEEETLEGIGRWGKEEGRRVVLTMPKTRRKENEGDEGEAWGVAIRVVGSAAELDDEEGKNGKGKERERGKREKMKSAGDYMVVKEMKKLAEMVREGVCENSSLSQRPIGFIQDNKGKGEGGLRWLSRSLVDQNGVNFRTFLEGWRNSKERGHEGGGKGVIILRGLSGSGKTTLISLLASFSGIATPLVCSADNFFSKKGGQGGRGEKGEVYTERFEVGLLEEAHEQCRDLFLSGIESDPSIVFVDNTNSRFANYKWYKEEALRRFHHIFFSFLFVSYLHFS